MIGTVAFYNDERGYGFINEPEESKSYFFHITNVIDTEENPIRGMKVEFDVKQVIKGEEAYNIKFI